VRLGLFDLLAARDGGDAGTIAGALGLADRPNRMLLAACTALGLTELGADGRFRNSTLAEDYLVSGGERFLGGFIQLVARQQYAGWAELSTALVTNQPTVWDSAERGTKFAGEGIGQITEFWQAMHAISESIAGLIARSFDFSRSRRLLDVGGGPANLDVLLCRRHPGLSATVFDLPEVCALTEARLRELGLGHRIGTVGGDLLDDESLPAGYDVLTLANVLHMWDPKTCVHILRKCHAALEDGAVVLIVEGFLDDDGSGPAAPALMSLNMLVDTAGGSNYSRADYTSMLAEAGFTATERIPLVTQLPLGANGIVLGRK
jgi:hypothetical protein